MMDKTLHWEFVESVEQPKIVTAAGGAVISKDNTFGQLTVRFHTLQVPCAISICRILYMYYICTCIYMQSIPNSATQ